MAIFFTITIFVVSLILVNALPTSVLVETKLQQVSSDDINAKEKANSVFSITEEPTNVNKINRETVLPQRLPVQKRGVKPNYYERDLANDILVNNNIPNGAWDEPEAGPIYPDLQDVEDYQPYQTWSFHQKPYDSLQTLLNANNYYEEPIALPVKYPYSQYYDERRKRGIDKDVFRLKREASKFNTADVLALLALLEANERNRYAEESDDINSIEYPRYSANGYTKDDDDNGEWWNELVEPSVQYSGNSYGHIEQNPHDRHSKLFPNKRYMVSKKKRSLSPIELRSVKSASKQLKFVPGFDRRYKTSEHY